MYLSLRPILDVVAEEEPAAALFARFVPFFNSPFALTLTAREGALEVDARFPSLGLPAKQGGAGARDVLAELPGDAWLGVGLPELGDRVSAGYATQALAGPLAGVDQRLRQATGLDPQAEILKWIGDAGFFLTGSSPSGPVGGVTVRSTDRALSARALRAFGRGLRGVRRPGRVDGADVAFAVSGLGRPERLEVAQRGDRVVAALGPAAAEAGLGAGGRLGEDERFSAAADALGAGYEPSVYLVVSPLLDAIEAAEGESPELARARPYLESVTDVVAGGGEDGRVRVRLRFAGVSVRGAQ